MKYIVWVSIYCLLIEATVSQVDGSFWWHSRDPVRLLTSHKAGRSEAYTVEDAQKPNQNSPTNILGNIKPQNVIKAEHIPKPSNSNQTVTFLHRVTTDKKYSESLIDNATQEINLGKPVFDYKENIESDRSNVRNVSQDINARNDSVKNGPFSLISSLFSETGTNGNSFGAAGLNGNNIPITTFNKTNDIETLRIDNNGDNGDFVFPDEFERTRVNSKSPTPQGIEPKTTTVHNTARDLYRSMYDNSDEKPIWSD